MIFDNKKIEAAIFDMDGTMFDTEALRMKMLKEASLLICDTELSDNFLYSAFGLSAESSQILAKDYYGKDYPYKEVRKKSDELELEYVRKNGVPIKIGLLGVLERLKKSDVLIALATSSKRQVALEYLTKAGVLNFFNIVICGDDVVKGKPDPEIFALAISELNVQSEKCIILEDSENGLLAAYASKAMPIYIKDIVDCSEETKSKAYKCYCSMEDFGNELAEFTPKMSVPALNEHIPQSFENIKAGIHGFGAIGGGYLAQIFSHWDGYVHPIEIIGATRDIYTRELINAYGKYSVLYESKAYLQTIRNISIIDINNKEDMIKMYTDCKIIGLSLPESVIKLQAKIIAEGLFARYNSGKDSLTLLIVLNKVKGGKFVREQVKRALIEFTDEELAANIIAKTYFCETVVNRMVSEIPKEQVIMSLMNNMSNIERSSSLLKEEVGNIYNLPKIKKIRRNGHKDEVIANLSEKLKGINGFAELVKELNITLFTSEPDMVLYADNKSPLLSQLRQIKTVQDISVLQNVKNKLSNGAHAILAWYASLLNYSSVGQGIGDRRVLRLIKDIMRKEIRPALISKNPEYGEYIDGFIDSFLKRCRVSFKDSCLRVGRDPLRKLQPSERVLGAIKMAKEEGIVASGLEFGAACGIMYSIKNKNPKDEEAAFIRQLYNKDKSIADILCFNGIFRGVKYKGLDIEKDKVLIENIQKAYNKLEDELRQNEENKIAE